MILIQELQRRIVRLNLYLDSWNSSAKKHKIWRELVAQKFPFARLGHLWYSVLERTIRCSLLELLSLDHIFRYILHLYSYWKNLLSEIISIITCILYMKQNLCGSFFAENNRAYSLSTQSSDQWRSHAGARWGTCPSNLGLCPSKHYPGWVLVKPAEDISQNTNNDVKLM